MAIVEWVIWAIGCVFLLSFFLAALFQHDPGIRSHHMRHCLLLVPGVLVTAITPISKFHLLWWVPVTFFLNMLLSTILLSLRLKRGLRNFEERRRESEIVLLKDSEWSVIDGEACRVTYFGTLGSLVDTDGKIHAMNKTTPYASITMECKKLGKNITGYVTHKMDFQHLWAAFKERKVKEDEEVIIIWTKKHYKYKLTKFLAPSMPRLWVMVCPKGAYDLMVDSSYKPELSGKARWDAMKPIIQWKPEVME
jgi:ribosomal protein S17E